MSRRSIPAILGKGWCFQELSLCPLYDLSGGLGTVTVLVSISLRCWCFTVSICVCVCVCYSLSRVWLFASPWTVACQDALSMEFSRQVNWSELPFPSPGDLPNPGIKPGFSALQADSINLGHQGSQSSMSRENWLVHHLGPIWFQSVYVMSLGYVFLLKVVPFSLPSSFRNIGVRCNIIIFKRMVRRVFTLSVSSKIYL